MFYDGNKLNLIRTIISMELFQLSTARILVDPRDSLNFQGKKWEEKRSAEVDV